MQTYISKDFEKITIENFKDSVVHFTYESDDVCEDELLEENLHITKIVDLMINKDLFEGVKDELGFLTGENVTSENMAQEELGEVPQKSEEVDAPKRLGDKAKISVVEKTLGSQVTFYFGDKNYFKDKFILNHVKQDPRVCMPVKYLMNFRLIKNLSEDFEFVKQALIKFSKDAMCTYELLEDGDMIKKKSIVVNSK